MFNWLKKIPTIPTEALGANVAIVAEPQVNIVEESAHYKNYGDRYFEVGKLEDAAASYRQAIAINPDYAEAYNNLSSVLREQGLPEEAERYLKQAILIKPELANPYCNLGSLLLERGKPNEAIEVLSKALELKADAEIIYRDLGYALFQSGQHEAAKQIIAKGLILNPGFADFHFFLGNMHWHANEFDEAVGSYQRALSIQPDYLEVLSNLGEVFQAQGKWDEAIDCCRKALAIKPDLAYLHFALALMFQEQEKADEAIDCYRKALVLKPDFAEAYVNLGNIFKNQGNTDEAIACYQKALTANPDSVEAHNNLGTIFKDRGKLDEAISCYQKALAISPDSADVYCNLGLVSQVYGKLKEAIAYFRRVLKLEPDHFTARTLMLHQLQHICEWEDLEANVKAVRRAALEAPATGKNLFPPFALLTIPGATAEEQKRCAERYVKNDFEVLFPLREKMGFEFKRTPNKKITIGYLSADFHDHATARLMAEAFELHSRDQFHIIAYSYGPDERSEMRKRLKNTFDQFVDIRDNSDKDSARRIYADHIDILVDLKGFTQNSRSAILALRPAPIQVNYLGYPGTMGADFVDYLIADKFIIPPKYQKHYTEKIVYLPNCYQPNDRTRARLAAPTRKECGLPEKGFIFCCFNQPYKITPDVFGIWCQLLKALPESSLWLLANNPHAEGNLKKEAANRGINPDRLVTAPMVETEKHLARLQCADLFLDTIPVNAHTTCSDALWMGLPVITCVGETFPSRVAGSLLSAMGVPELITYNLDDYYHLAFDLATDKKKLNAIRSKIIANLDTAPLFDSELFTRNLEKAYIQMMDAYSEKATSSAS